MSFFDSFVDWLGFLLFLFLGNSGDGSVGV